MNKKSGENRKKVVSGIAIRRKSGERAREILIVKNAKSETWEFPGVELGYDEDGVKPLRDHLSRELTRRKDGDNKRRVGINHPYHNFLLNGELLREEDKRSIETYFVTVYGRVNNEKRGIRWVDLEQISGDNYPTTKATERIIGY